MNDFLSLPFAFILAMMLALNTCVQGVKTGCEETLISQIEAPNTHRRARVAEEVCTDGLFVTTANYLVWLETLPDAEKSSLWVLSVGASGRRGEIPEIAWWDDDRLIITIDNHTVFFGRKTSALGVDVELRFTPDDSAERSRWLRDIAKNYHPHDPQAQANWLREQEAFDNPK